MDQRNSTQEILSSYEVCNCIWNKNDDNAESVSAIDNSNKPNENSQQNARQEHLQCSLLSVDVEAEIASTRLLTSVLYWFYNIDDSLLCDDELAGASGRDIQYSSDSQDSSGDLNVDENYVTDGLLCDNPKESKERVGARDRDIQTSIDSEDSSGDQNVDEDCVTPFTNTTTKSCGNSFEHSLKQKYKCSYCLKKFSKNSDHQRHIVIHTGELPFECECCGRRFNQKAGLARHRRSHSDGKPFICDWCGVEFPLRCALKLHLRSERKNKHFVCDFCGKKFALKARLMDHRSSHTFEKQFQCAICGMGYIHRQSLQKHMKTHH